MNRYFKVLAAIAATILSGIVGGLTDGKITPNEWINVAIAGVGAAGVYWAPNVPGAMYTKLIIAVLTAVLTALASFIGDGVISSAEVLQMAVIALGALGVYAVPNKVTEARAATP